MPGRFLKFFPLFRRPADYGRASELARSGRVGQRLTLASDSRTHREILYYLAENDPDARVRKAVATNPATPAQANLILAKDTHEDVRLALAGRLILLLPELSADRQSQLYAFAVQALGMLALDEVLKIRRALSSALKDHAHAPPDVVGRLARDIERDIAEPVLRFCTALADEDLIDILKGHPAGWAVQAIAGRRTVSSFISQAVIETGDVGAGRILIENEGAAITRELLQDIVRRARETPEWQAPVAKRKTLPPEMARELAEFAQASVRDLLFERGDFDGETIEAISTAFSRRLGLASDREAMEDKGESPAERAARLAREGRLDEECIGDALGMREREFVLAAIAGLAGLAIDDVKRVVEMKAPKPVIAVCWKAGLSMRMALRLQKDLCFIPPRELVYPRDGTDFPLSGEEMDWQLEFLGLAGPKKRKRPAKTKRV